MLRIAPQKGGIERVRRIRNRVVVGIAKIGRVGDEHGRNVFFPEGGVVASEEVGKHLEGGFGNW